MCELQKICIARNVSFQSSRISLEERCKSICTVLFAGLCMPLKDVYDNFFNSMTNGTSPDNPGSKS